MRKVLILGGYGFLGKNLNQIFGQDENYIIKNESRRTGVNVLDYNVLKAAVFNFDPDIIINAVAHVGSVKYVMENPVSVAHDNIQMVLNIFKVCDELNKELLLINPLSNCAYPDTNNIQVESEFWSGPMHHSVQPYGISKKVICTLTDAYRKENSKLNVVNLIMPNAFGPGDYMDPVKVHALNGIILRMINAQYANDKEFVLWGSSKPIREWLFMQDAARIMYKIIDEQLDIPELINIGQEQGFSIRESAEVIRKLLDYDVEFKIDLSYPDGTPKKVMSSKLFRKYFPTFEFTTYKEGIRKSIEYYKSIL